MHVMTFAWLVILAAALCIEVVTLVHKRPGDTLREHLCEWLIPDDDRRFFWSTFRRASLTLALGRVLLYMATGGRI